MKKPRKVKPFNDINQVNAQILINYACTAQLRDELTLELKKIQYHLAVAERTLKNAAKISCLMGIPKTKLEDQIILWYNRLDTKRISVGLRLNAAEKKILEFEYQRQLTK